MLLLREIFGSDAFMVGETSASFPLELRLARESELPISGVRVEEGPICRVEAEVLPLVPGVGLG